VKMEFNEFVGRKRKKGVQRVFETAGGCGISHEDVTTKEGKTIHFSKAGVDYEGWINGRQPEPIKDLHCPYQHTGQGLQCKDVNGVYEKRCSKYLSLGGIISQCKGRDQMNVCWAMYEGRMP